MSRLTYWNYKNTTLALEICKPYLKLGEIEDLEEKYNADVNEDLFKKAKAFEVIKEKRVDMFLLYNSENVEAYNRELYYLDIPEKYYLDKEEFTSLKEMI